MLQFLILSFLLPALASSITNSIRIDLNHIDSNGNYTNLELIQRAAQRSHHRMARLMPSNMKIDSSNKEVQMPVHAGLGEYLMDLAIGTPSSSFSAILDTGSDLIWTQCKPCVQCFEQPSPLFDPASSSTFSKLPCSSELCSDMPTSKCSSTYCDYLYTYGDSSSTQGLLAAETFTFGSTSVASIGFGCGDTNQGGGFSQASGLVGLGRGPLSLISQLGLGKFSYCLTTLDQKKKSPLFFGSLAEINGSSLQTVQSTPLVRNPSQPSFYYLNLEGITVGDTRIKMPSSTFAVQEDGSGGLIIDSGTSITYLDVAGYKLVKKAFLSQMKLPVADGSDMGLDLCFSTAASSSMESVEVPKMVFNFDGADLDLPASNYMVIDSNESGGLLCLTMVGSSGMSILGNFQQQNIQILYDLEKDTLSFMQVQCDQL